MRSPRYTARLLSIFGALTLVACGTSPDRLDAPKTMSHLVMAQNMHWKSRPLSSGIEYENILSSGDYVAKYADGMGVYHLGPRACLRRVVRATGWALDASMLGKTAIIYDCGVYVPNDPKNDPRLFYVVGEKSGNFLTLQEVAEQENAAATTLQNQAIASGATPVAAGAGTAIGMGLGSAIAKAEYGNVIMLDFDEDRQALRRAMVLQNPSVDVAK